YTQHLFEALSSSDLVLPISESSAKDMVRFCRELNINVPEYKVIRLGDDIGPKDLSDDKDTPDGRLSNEFILCVGTVEIRKNHTQLYYAYKLAQEKNIELPQLVIVGNNGWL